MYRGPPRSSRPAPFFPYTTFCRSLYQIINLRPGADDVIGPGPAVDGGVGADLDAVAYDDAAELRHVDEALGVHREAEAAGAEAGAGMDLAGAADLAIGQRNVGEIGRASGRERVCQYV